jgi:predicted anti-sigma-YlaC factor YlaD
MRAWISAELDGELFEFESILLRAHLAGCEACRTFKHDVAAFSGTLRDAPLEAMSRPVVVSRRSRLAFRPLRVPGVAALAVLMIASGGLFTSLHSGAIFSSPKTRSVGVLDEGDVYQIQRMGPVRALAQLRLRREAMAAASQIPRTTGFQNP